MHRIDVSTLRSRRDMIERLSTVEQALHSKATEFVTAKSRPNLSMKARVKKKRRKKGKGLLVRSKSEDRGPLESVKRKRGQLDPMESVQNVDSLQPLPMEEGLGALSEGGLAPLDDDEELSVDQMIETDFDALDVNGDTISVDDVDGQDIALWLDSTCDFAECLPRRRVIEALCDYQSEPALEQIAVQHPHLLSDWHHLLCVHLNGTTSNNARCFEALYDDIQRQHLLCDLQECCHYQRNNRDRETVGSEEVDFMMDLLDTIHVHLVCLTMSFVHSFSLFSLQN